ncbi:hypothetical protein FRC12_024894 [Ceratobasidium sp. 428]|nr:hypothetical protein FRC12_024894 [Ceratobasidium sp. 428]
MIQLDRQCYIIFSPFLYRSVYIRKPQSALGLAEAIDLNGATVEKHTVRIDIQVHGRFKQKEDLATALRKILRTARSVKDLTLKLPHHNLFEAFLSTLIPWPFTLKSLTLLSWDTTPIDFLKLQPEIEELTVEFASHLSNLHGLASHALPKLRRLRVSSWPDLCLVQGRPVSDIDITQVVRVDWFIESAVYKWLVNSPAPLTRLRLYLRPVGNSRSSLLEVTVTLVGKTFHPTKEIEIMIALAEIQQELSKFSVLQCFRLEGKWKGSHKFVIIPSTSPEPKELRDWTYVCPNLKRLEMFGDAIIE